MELLKALGEWATALASNSQREYIVLYTFLMLCLAMLWRGHRGLVKDLAECKTQHKEQAKVAKAQDKVISRLQISVSALWAFSQAQALPALADVELDEVLEGKVQLTIKPQVLPPEGERRKASRRVDLETENGQGDSG